MNKLNIKIKILIPFLLITLTAHSFSQSQTSTALSCKIYSSKKTFESGKRPKIYAEFKNNTDSTIYLVKGLDHSYNKSRYPYSYFKITKDDWNPQQILTCGNSGGIFKDDFIELKPQQVYKTNSLSGYLGGYDISNANNFVSEGIYKITFYYSSKDEGFDNWMGDNANLWFIMYMDGRKEIKPQYKEEYEEMLRLFSKVPKVDLVSNTIYVNYVK